MQTSCVSFGRGVLPGETDATIIFKATPGSRRWQHLARAGNGDAAHEENYTVILGSHRNSSLKIERDGQPCHTVRSLAHPQHAHAHVLRPSRKARTPKTCMPSRCRAPPNCSSPVPSSSAFGYCIAAAASASAGDPPAHPRLSSGTTPLPAAACATLALQPGTSFWRTGISRCTTACPGPCCPYRCAHTARSSVACMDGNSPSASLLCTLCCLWY